MKNVFVIPGSTRKKSTNLNLIHAIENLSKDRFIFTIFDGLSELPHFNPDLDTDSPPNNVTEFRNQIRAFDGVLICTPEYAMGVPGSLKNALDWIVSSMEFSKKPVALITASTSGKLGHASLLETLRVIEAEVTEHTQLLISFSNSKITSAAGITDDATLTEIKNLILAFDNLMDLPKGD